MTQTGFSRRFDEALAFASELHRHQKRKGSNIPYISHLLGVAALAIEDGADEDQAIAALLHDAAEDQGGFKTLEEIRDRFGDRVANIVDACTDTFEDPKPDWRERKEAYLAAMPLKLSDALLVSLADKTHNASAIVHDVRHHGNQVWGRFTGGRAGTVWYYRQLSDHFARLRPGPAAARLEALVAEMSELAGSREKIASQ